MVLRICWHIKWLFWLEFVCRFRFKRKKNLLDIRSPKSALEGGKTKFCWFYFWRGHPRQKLRKSQEFSGMGLLKAIQTFPNRNKFNLQYFLKPLVGKLFCGFHNNNLIPVFNLEFLILFDLLGIGKEMWVLPKMSAVPMVLILDGNRCAR